MTKTKLAIVLAITAFVSMLSVANISLAAPIVIYATPVIRAGVPSAGSGYQATIGALYVNKSTGIVYVKTGSGATAWSTVVGASGSPTGSGTTDKIPMWTGTSTLGDSLLNAADGGGGRELNYNGGKWIVNSNTGTMSWTGSTTAGDSVTADTHTVNGALIVVALESTFTSTTSGATGSSSMLSPTRSGTFDTTSGALTSGGINQNVTTTRSAGANNLTNRAARFNASGAQVNIALTTDAGDNYLNASSGSSGVGYASGATIPTLFSVNGAATVVGALNGYTQVTQVADQDVTNLGLTDSNTLTISVTAGKIYAIEGFISAGGNNTTGDYIFDWAVAAGTMDCNGTEASLTVADAIQNTTIIATAAADTADTSVGTRADASIPIAIFFTIGCKVSNTTTLKYRFGNAAASAGRTSRTMAGSFIKWKQLN